MTCHRYYYCVLLPTTDKPFRQALCPAEVTFLDPTRHRERELRLVELRGRRRRAAAQEALPCAMHLNDAWEGDADAPLRQVLTILCQD